MKTPTGDRLYKTITTLCAASIPAVLLLVALVVVRGAWPVLGSRLGELLTTSRWSIAQGHYGALPVLAGTLVTSAGAVLLAGPLGIGVALLTAELAPRAVRAPAAFAVNLLAAVPSVIYGLWGMFVLVPLLRRTVMPALIASGLPFTAGPAYGPSVLAATLVLALMILPYVAGVSHDVLQAIPRAQREAALALGATQWEMIRDAVLPSARSGLVGAVLLGLARALGETMAVAMVVGNRHAVPHSLLDPAYTISALLAVEFGEASDATQVGALMAITALLLVVTLLVNVLARLLVSRVAGNDSRLLPA
jgi:phosphate transport system permease protein